MGRKVNFTDGEILKVGVGTEGEDVLGLAVGLRIGGCPGLEVEVVGLDRVQFV